MIPHPYDLLSGAMLAIAVIFAVAGALGIILGDATRGALWIVAAGVWMRIAQEDNYRGGNPRCAP